MLANIIGIAVVIMFLIGLIRVPPRNGQAFIWMMGTLVLLVLILGKLVK